MPRTRKPKPTDIPEQVLDHCTGRTGPARPRSQVDVDAITRRLKKAMLKTRSHFPPDEAATTLLWLALRNITATWGKEAHYWRSARNQFAIAYGERFTAPGAP